MTWPLAVRTLAPKPASFGLCVGCGSALGALGFFLFCTLLAGLMYFALWFCATPPVVLISYLSLVGGLAVGWFLGPVCGFGSCILLSPGPPVLSLLITPWTSDREPETGRMLAEAAIARQLDSRRSTLVRKYTFEAYAYGSKGLLL